MKTAAVNAGEVSVYPRSEGHADESDGAAVVLDDQSRSGQTVDGSNFRSDVTFVGSLNSADIGLVKSKSGTALSAPIPNGRR
ncbi:MAG: hypothetical protein H0T83_06840 [Chthoniobacterales bacterium]|nr:hypothetical protein [Chthoniobacterales bacterium]